MKAEISHYGYLRQARYSGVYLQQGAMITDRDWNAGADRLKARLQASAGLAYDAGIPRRRGLLAAFAETDATNHVWAVAFANEGGWVAAEGVAALALPAVEGTPFGYANQADLPKPPDLKLDYLYADIWEETVTAYDDPDLADPGLHGAHTAFVSRLRVQIKQCTKDQWRETECGSAADPVTLPAIGGGRFDLQMRSGPAGTDACDPCADSVDLEHDVGNALFRAEIHDVVYDKDGLANEVTIKWSSENGAVQFLRPASTDSLPDDQLLEFFHDGHGMLLGLPAGGYEDRPARGLLLFDKAGFAGAPAELGRIRRWDGFARIDLANETLLAGRDDGLALTQSGDPNNHGHVRIANGACVLNLSGLVLALDFSSTGPGPKRTAILAGDHWMAVLRIRAAPAEKIKVLSALPSGIRHHYCILGQHKDGAAIIDVAAADKRRLSFPDLTCLRSGDVAFKPDCTTSIFDSPAAAKVTNVAEALRLLCDVKASQISYTTNCDFLKEKKTVQQALDKLCGRNHWSLRMSAGTGQEGREGEPLKNPIEILVEDQDGLPVKGAKVELRTVAPTASGDSLAEAGNVANAGAVIQITSDADGYVRARWTLGKIVGAHSVSADVVNPPQQRAAKLWYSAELVERTAQSRLPVLKAVEWNDGTPFENDSAVSASTFAKGFALVLTETVAAPKAVSNDVVFAIAEPPRTFVEAGINFPLIVLCANVQAEDNRLVYQPNADSLRDVLRAMSKNLPDCAPKEGLRVRIRALGRFILTKGGLLDGFVPGRPKGDQVSLDFGNPGIGQPSDFEAWIYVDTATRPIRLKDLALADINAAGIADPARSAIFLRTARSATSMDDFLSRFKPSPDELKIIQENFTF